MYVINVKKMKLMMNLIEYVNQNVKVMKYTILKRKNVKFNLIV